MIRNSEFLFQHLKAVQMQIQSVNSKRVLTPADQAALHRLYDEQQRILLTGKVVPTIPGQHAVGLPLVSKPKLHMSVFHVSCYLVSSEGFSLIISYIFLQI